MVKLYFNLLETGEDCATDTYLDIDQFIQLINNKTGLEQFVSLELNFSAIKNNILHKIEKHVIGLFPRLKYLLLPHCGIYTMEDLKIIQNILLAYPRLKIDISTNENMVLMAIFDYIDNLDDNNRALFIRKVKFISNSNWAQQKLNKY